MAPATCGTWSIRGCCSSDDGPSACGSTLGSSAARRHSAILPSSITNAVLASPPAPGPQPPPGRSVSSNVATMKPSSSVASTSSAPQGSASLKAITSSRLSRSSGGVPFWAMLGTAK